MRSVPYCTPYVCLYFLCLSMRSILSRTPCVCEVSSISYSLCLSVRSVPYRTPCVCLYSVCLCGQFHIILPVSVCEVSSISYSLCLSVRSVPSRTPCVCLYSLCLSVSQFHLVGPQRPGHCGAGGPAEAVLGLATARRVPAGTGQHCQGIG